MKKQTNLGHFPRRKLDGYLTKNELLPYAEEWTIFLMKTAGKAGFMGFALEGFAL